MNMRVSLFLDFIYKKGASQAAKRDILDLKRAAKDLGKSSGGAAAARDIERMATAGRKARAEIAGAAKEYRHLRDARGRFVRGGGGGGPAAGKGAPAQGGGKGGGASIIPGGRGMLAGVATIYAAKKAIDATIGSSITFEKAMANVKKKVDLPVGESWEKLEKTIVNNALAFGRSREEIADLVSEGAAAGIAYQDLTAWTKLSTKAAIGWDMTAGETSQKLAEIKAATGWTIAEMEDFADKVNYLGDTSAAKESDILEMFQRAGAAAKAAGVDFDISLASLTALRSIGMKDEVASRFFAAFTGKLRTATGQGKKMAEGLKMLGTSAKQVERGMKTDAMGTMIDLLQRMEASPDKAAAAIKVMGREWWDEMARMGRGIPEMIKNLEGLRQLKYKGSLAGNLQVELSTTANHLTKLKTLAEEVGDRFGRWALPGINKTIENALDLMKRVDEKSDRDKAEKNAENKERIDQGLDDGKPKEPEMSGVDSFENGIVRFFSGDPNDKRLGQDALMDWWLGKKDNPKEQLAEAQKRGRERARKEADDTLLEWQKRAQYRSDMENDAKNGNMFQRFLSRKQLDDLHDWDKKAEPIQRRRLAEVQDRKARLQQDGIDGSRIFSPDGKFGKAPMRIGARAAYDLGLGGGGPITDRKQENTDFTLPKAAAQQANLGMSGALGGDMSSAGQKAMSSFAAGITAGGAQAVAAANAVAGQVNAALSRAGSGAGGGIGSRLSGSLHDGPTGG